MIFSFLFTLFLNSIFPTEISQNNNFRRILIFSSDSKNLLYKQQNQIFLEQMSEFKERDVHIEFYQYKPENAKIFKNFRVEQKPFTLLLIGKDGFIKLRSNEILSAAYIFGIIDEMPMRKDEIKLKKRGNRTE